MLASAQAKGHPRPAAPHSPPSPFHSSPPSAASSCAIQYTPRPSPDSAPAPAPGPLPMRIRIRTCLFQHTRTPYALSQHSLSRITLCSMFSAPLPLCPSLRRARSHRPASQILILNVCMHACTKASARAGRSCTATSAVDVPSPSIPLSWPHIEYRIPMSRWRACAAGGSLLALPAAGGLVLALLSGACYLRCLLPGVRCLRSCRGPATKQDAARRRRRARCSSLRRAPEVLTAVRLALPCLSCIVYRASSRIHHSQALLVFGIRERVSRVAVRRRRAKTRGKRKMRGGAVRGLDGWMAGCWARWVGAE
ncbi:hypothetical protein DENSPDRAFT_594442 [Dentipellis sp. KUC8613]|nr:hypothetical protein DENSPDRAFT_594442 [Dentipellis sp. KUC8613]